MRKWRELMVVLFLSFAAAANGQNIPDIRDSLEPLELAERSGLAMLAACATTILMLAVLLWLKFGRRSRYLSVESPETRAARLLTGLVEVRPREFYAELHSIFVEYLERRVLIKASRCTTPELLDALEKTALISEDWRASAKRFLADCDQAKFSPSWPDRAPDAALAECRALISQVAAAPLLAMGPRESRG